MSSRIPFKKCAIILFLCFFFVASFQITSLAACSHSSLGTQYCDADHPHAYYKTCKSCGQKVYTGGYATKAHGDGSRGSGTCPSCGTHSYGTTYSEATHPHRYHANGDQRGHRLRHGASSSRCSASKSSFQSLRSGTSRSVITPRSCRRSAIRSLALCPASSLSRHR